MPSLHSQLTTRRYGSAKQHFPPSFVFWLSLKWVHERDKPELDENIGVVCACVGCHAVWKVTCLRLFICVSKFVLSLDVLFCLHDRNSSVWTASSGIGTYGEWRNVKYAMKNDTCLKWDCILKCSIRDCVGESVKKKEKRKPILLSPAMFMVALKTTFSIRFHVIEGGCSSQANLCTEI